MNYSGLPKYRSLIALGLAWACAIPAAILYYHGAGTQLWQPPGLLGFDDWLSMPIFMGLAFSRSFQPGVQFFNWRVIPWLLTPFALCIGITRLTAASIQLFLSYPTVQPLSSVSYGGGLLLLAYLAWILSFPIGSPPDPFGQRLYRSTHIFLLALGLVLTIIIFQTLMTHNSLREGLPPAEMIAFYHQFQRLGVLVLLLLFLRICLPATLFEIALLIRPANRAHQPSLQPYV